MEGCIEERVIDVAGYIVEHKATVREIAKVFGISKSTVHKDVTYTRGWNGKMIWAVKQGEIRLWVRLDKIRN